MKYQVIISSTNGIRETDKKSEKISDTLRKFGEEVVSTSDIIYSDAEGNTLLGGPVSFVITATQLKEVEGRIHLVLESGVKATLNRTLGATISIQEITAAGADEDDEEDEAPAPKKKGPPAKKGKPVVEDDEEEAEEDEDDEEDEAPTPKKAAGKKGGKPVVEEEDDFDFE